jgi:parvulin-like peptidyl-prolyl isomerase
MKNRKILPALAGLLVVAAACGDDISTEGTLARAGSYVLTVDQAVDLLVDEENLPNTTAVVEALANLWIDYTLLADAAATDSTFSDMNLEDLVVQQLEQEMIFQLRDSVMQVDTSVTEDELRDIYANEAPGAQLEASHILLGFPQGASDAERDSVRAEVEAIRVRALGRESFAALAEEFSQDRGSAALGGSLGSFGRGDMVRPFEEAAFAMEVGEISEIVETPFGLHIIRLDSRRMQDFDEVAPQFRSQVQSRRFIEAESLFVAAIEERAAPEIQDDVLEIVHDLAREPGSRLAGRARRRALVDYNGGEFTVGEFQLFIQTRTTQFRDQVANSPDDQIENLLKSLVQRELLVTEARGAGLEPPAEQIATIIENARDQLRVAAGDIGVLRLDRAPGEPVEPAVSRAVMAALEGVLTGAKDVIPLGQIAFQLRQREPTSVSGTGTGETIVRIGEIRAGRGLAPFEQAPPEAPDPDSIVN